MCGLQRRLASALQLNLRSRGAGCNDLNTRRMKSVSWPIRNNLSSVLLYSVSDAVKLRYYFIIFSGNDRIFLKC